ncbi:MAG: hypothetical protein E6501_31090, partial [Bradyrhizobium sp.]|nr:hypothetical protein [Bradyrhizobium sp.]
TLFASWAAQLAALGGEPAESGQYDGRRRPGRHRGPAIDRNIGLDVEKIEHALSARQIRRG